MTLDERRVPMTKDRSNAMTLGALGMLSGAVAWVLMNLTDWALSNLTSVVTYGKLPGLGVRWTIFHGVITLSPLTLFPGLVFGLVIGVLLHHRGKVEGLRQAGYVVAAGVAYLCASHTALHVFGILFSSEKDVVGYVISGIPAGFVGTLLLGLMTMLLLRVPGRLVLRRPVWVGGAAGVLLALIAPDHTRWGWSFLAFVVLWQGAYAASLAPLLRPASLESAAPTEAPAQ